MGHKRSPSEKRLRGFLSGDPLRVARTVDRTCGIVDPVVHAHMAANLDVLVAATCDIPLPKDRRALLDRYIERLRGGILDDPNCACQTFRGNPAQVAGTLHETSRVTHSGWSEITLTCENCTRSYEVTEDVGYHVPQYSWRAL